MLNIIKTKKIVTIVLSTVLLSACSGKSSSSSAPAVPAPSTPSERTALSSVTAYGVSQEEVPLSISMDEVPESYYTEPEEQGTIEKFTYTTNTYGLYGQEEKEIEKYAEVYLPYGYDSSKQYNIAYLMHGAGGSAERFFGSADSPRDLKAIVDNMIALGEMEPMIFVGLTYYPVNGQDRQSDWDADYTRYYNYELQDVLPQVESHYSTYASSTDEAGLVASRDHRMFGGYSMGAVTTYYRMCDSMRYFRTYLAMSGSLYWGPDAMGNDNFDAGDYMIKAITDEGYTADDFFVFAAAGSEDFSLDFVNRQIDSEKNHPEFFRYGEDGSIANCAYEIGQGEEHSGGHGSDRYMYNYLPQISKLMSAS